MAYAAERKEAVLKKMLPPGNGSIRELAASENISEQTLYGWRKQAREEGRLMPNSDLTPKGWTSRDKFAAVLETAAMSEAEVAAFCRSKGLHTHQLNAWRAACEQANDWDRASTAQRKSATRESEKKTKRLEKELARKDRALAEAAALLVLRGKLDAMYDKDEDG